MSKGFQQNFNGAAVGLGTCFFVVFWQVFDSLALGVALGTTMGVAFSATGKNKCDPDTED